MENKLQSTTCRTKALCTCADNSFTHIPSQNRSHSEAGKGAGSVLHGNDSNLAGHPVDEGEPERFVGMWSDHVMM